MVEGISGAAGAQPSQPMEPARNPSNINGLTNQHFNHFITDSGPLNEFCQNLDPNLSQPEKVAAFKKFFSTFPMILRDSDKMLNNSKTTSPITP